MLDRPLPLRTAAAVLLFALVAFSGLIAFLLGGEESAPTDRSPALLPAGTRPDAELAAHLGDEACASCHPRESAAHARTRHAATLHAVGQGPLPFHLPVKDHFVDPATSLQYQFERQGDRCRFTVEAPEGPRSGEAQYAFGSGKTGITLVGSTDDTVREFRMSYFPARRRWEVTPGQRSASADPLGTRHDRATAQRCFSCHATVIAASRVLPEARFMGVGCESCHGPGRAHLEAVRRGDADRRIERLGRWDGTRINTLCGRCHRTERELDPLDTFALSQTQRFQPVGLAKSACFQQSAGRLTCVTCHDPHTDARTDEANYVKVCVSCHTPPAFRRSGVQAFRRSGVGKIAPDRPNAQTPERLSRACPVSPRGGCISCHMPDCEVVRGIRMADHWIRVFPHQASQQKAPSAGRSRR
jgi:hypothetical protein